MFLWEISEETLNLYKKYEEKYPGVKEEHFNALANCGWYGLDLSEKKIIGILEKCIQEDKIFQVWNLSYKEDPDNPPLDWWKGKLVFKKYKPNK
jgi:hypothetical protein